MNVNQFYDDVKAWIEECNRQAARSGMHSNDFWLWVTRSIGELCNKYNNEKLAVMQFTMMYEWLTEIYNQGKEKT